VTQPDAGRAASAIGRVTLRREGKADRAFMAWLYASTRTDELSAVPWSDEEKAAFVAMQFEAQTRHYDEYYGDASRMVVERDGVPAGRLYLQHRDDEIRVVDIALLPEHRGAGLGSMLMSQVIGEARRTRRAVRIHVERENRALRLYRRLGFRQIEDKGVYLLLEWRDGE
jgi:ribosomal protein S18 acetylase RimI-like enzyme